MELRLRAAMFGASVELRLIPGTGGSKVAEKRLVEGRCWNWEVSSPDGIFRDGGPADDSGLESSGIEVF